MERRGNSILSMVPILLKLAFLVGIAAIVDTNEMVPPLMCAHFKHENVVSDTASKEESGQEVAKSCSKESDSCNALWTEDPVNKSIIVLIKGCWTSSGDDSCGRTECVASAGPTKAMNTSKFCCCTGNMCNLNISDGYIPPTGVAPNHPNPVMLLPDPRFQEIKSTSAHTAIALASVMVLAFVGLVAFIVYRFFCNNYKLSSDSLHLMEHGPPPSPSFDLNSLKLMENVGRGRYGSVCRGLLHDHPVAVKVFAFQNRQYFYNERDIYCLHNMEHPGLPKYIGSEERPGADGRPEYLLVLQYAPLGCLHDYLRINTFDWARLCKILLSITQGLSHLHSEIRKSDKVKMGIAHRDLTSRNILVKSDGSCMLCDFGFAIQISGCKYYQNGEEQVAETTSLTDVGTLRYMAPEILEGAVNLRDCEASLKQIDVYALGLVLWETASRCSDLFQGTEVPEYKLPFEAEVGTHPSMEQMQVLVAKNKARPLFPVIWKDTNPAVRTLKETIEECWDQDAEARLTTLCVKERISELPLMWERYKAGLIVPGVSPSVNPTSNLQKQAGSVPSQVINVDESTLVTDSLNNNNRVSVGGDRMSSVSETTTDTLLSPSEPLPQSTSKNVLVNDKNVSANNSIPPSTTTFPLQPHQGRNPCLERNLMMESLDDISVSGNMLVEKASRPYIQEGFRSLSDGDADILIAPNFGANLDTNSLFSGDTMNHSMRVCNPIPYVQNAVHLAPTIPKQANAPGNGHTLGLQNSSRIKEDKCWGPLGFFDRRRGAKEGFRAGLRNLLDRKSNSVGKDLSEEQQPLRGYSSGGCCSPTTPGTLDGKLGQTNPVDYCWSPDDAKENDQLVDTEVCISKPDCTSTMVRPISNMQTSEEELVPPTEKMMPSKNFIVKDGDSPKHVRCPEVLEENPVEKTKRPTTLPVQTFQNGFFEDGDAENSEDEITRETSVQIINSNNPVVTMRRKGSNGKRKGVKRVKTPFEIKGRFSLYDDRIMSSQELPTNQDKNKDGCQAMREGPTKFSASVPIGMNTLCSQPSVHVEQASLSKMQQVSKMNGFRQPVSRDQVQTVHSLCDI